MRRLFIIRKDLHLTAGKLAAMVSHCAEAYWLNLLMRSYVKDNEFDVLPVEIPGDPNYWKLYRHPAVYEAAKAAHERGDKTFVYKAENSRPTISVVMELPKDVWNDYINDIFTKTICEAKNLNHLMKVVDIAKELGLQENIDYGFIDDCCKTELTPEFTDENGQGRCRIGIWFKPLPDEISHKLSKKYQLYKD
jgi:peptidyl-tRNA hydrolase